MQALSDQMTKIGKPKKLGQSSAAELALQLLARDFALHCRRFRSMKGLTQTQLAEQMGIRNLKGKITVSRWESGKITPKKHHLIKFLNLQRKYDNQK